MRTLRMQNARMSANDSISSPKPRSSIRAFGNVTNSSTIWIANAQEQEPQATKLDLPETAEAAAG